MGNFEVRVNFPLEGDQKVVVYTFLTLVTVG